MAKFEPKILAFLCNWCAYAGADLAADALPLVRRIHYTLGNPCRGEVQTLDLEW